MLVLEVGEHVITAGPWVDVGHRQGGAGAHADVRVGLAVPMRADGLGRGLPVRPIGAHGWHLAPGAQRDGSRRVAQRGIQQRAGVWVTL